jgi:hypothetical protein
MKVEPAGAVDLHVHCGPEGNPAPLRPRPDRGARGRGWLRTMVLKSHFTSTSGWAEIRTA